MLERATSCLESAGRRFLRDPNSVARSRRSLSSRLWTQDLTRADIPHWFLALLQATGQRPSPVLSTEHGKGAVDGGEPFLDFLCPRQTQSLVGSRLSRPQKRLALRRKRPNAGFLRSYTSASGTSQAVRAEQTVLDELERWTKESLEPPEPKELHKTRPRRRRTASEKLALILQEVPSDQYHNVWMAYLAAGSPSKYSSAVLSYLSGSSDANHQEWAWTVFQTIPRLKRSKENYRDILFSQHRSTTQIPVHVMSICQQALSTPMASFCIEWSLIYALKSENWSEVLEIWNLNSQIPICSRMPSGKYLDVFRNKDFPASSLAGTLLSLAEYLQSGKRDPQFVEFAHDLFHRFVGDQELPKLTPTSSLLQLIEKYRPLGFIENNFYLNMIKHFRPHKSPDTRSECVQSIIFYRQFRLDMPDEKLPGKLLTQLFDRAVTFEMIESVEYLLEELAHFQGKPPIAAYREALKVYAKTGDVSKVHRTFDRLVADHGNPKSRRLLSPILSVHARLGDVSETKRQFDRISAEFGLQPNTVCWNILIQAYVTAGDLPGAASTFAKMMKKGETPSSHTFGTIMALFAKRGDIQNVSRLIDEARKMKVEVTRPMMDTVVRVYLKNDKHDHAEKLVCATWKTATGGSPVQLWNTLLWHHAFKVQKRYFSRILGEIGKHGLKPDAGTYAAIIFAHAITQQPDEARSVLRKMAKAGIEPTEQHYSIVMFAYMKRRNRDMVHVILHEMQTRFGRVGMSASLVNLKMQIERDLENAKRADTPAENLSFPHAEKALMTSINQFNGDPSPTKMPSIDASGSARQHFPAVHYQHLIQAYGNEAAIDKAREALGQYLQSVQSTSSSDEKMVKLPFGFIKALMSAHLKAHEFDKVEEYWKILWPGITTFASRFDLDQILPVAPTVTETGRTGRTKSEVLSSQQFILDAPLHMYMRSLASENNYRKLHRVVSKVQEAGFVLTASNWSTYIELLTVSDDRSEQIQAFKLFEKMFQPKFPGWFYMKRGFGLRPAGSAATLLDLEGRVGLTAPRRVMGKIARRHWLRIHPDYMHPSYRTIVYLARRLKSIRASSIEDGSGTLSELFETTPGTIQILADMPQLPDKYQNQLLRDGEKEPEVLRKPKALRSTSSGLLGEGERLKRRSISKAEIQPRSRRDIEPSNTAREQFNVLTKVLPPSDRVTMEMQFHKYLKPMSVGRKRPTRRIIVLDRPKRNTIIRAKPKQHPESLSPKEETPKKQASSKHTASTKSTVSTKGMSFKARAQLASTSNPIWTLYNPKTGYHEPRKVHTKRRDRRSGIIRRDYLRKATSKARPGPSSPETKAGYSDSLFEWRRALR